MKIFLLFALTFCAIFAALHNSHAAPPALSAPAVAAYDKLRQTEIFALGGVGFAGTTSPGELAFRQLQRESNATAIFIALLDDQTATKAGQLYALLGLKEAKDTRFEERLSAFLEDDSPVTRMRGCLIVPQKVKEIAARFATDKAARA